MVDISTIKSFQQTKSEYQPPIDIIKDSPEKCIFPLKEKSQVNAKEELAFINLEFDQKCLILLCAGVLSCIVSDNLLVEGSLNPPEFFL